MSKVEELKTQIKNGTYDWDSAVNDLAEVLASRVVNNKEAKND